MAMATALAGSSLSVSAAVQRTRQVWRGDIQRLRTSAPMSQTKNLRISTSATRVEAPTFTDSVSQGANTIAGALFAAMATSDSAMATQQLMTLAADDNRGFAILIPLIPAVGWVLYNILQPGLNQWNKMRNIKGLVAGLGLGALGSLAFSAEAEAAVQEIAQVADSDNRGVVLLATLIPAVAWVLYNILQPALNQLNKMRSAKGLVGAAGLGGAASLLFSEKADAAQEIAQLAESDARGLVLLVVLAPAVGWVLYNILQPGLNQLNKMRNLKGLPVALGLGAAASSLLYTPDAEAAQEITQLAADSRPTILLVVMIPAVGWVLYNILRPALNQLNKMRSGK